MAASDPLLISMSEIARLAGVERPVVTTWRSRHPSFPPSALADSSRTLFDANAVVDWLVDTGRADRDVIEPELRSFTLYQMATRLGSRSFLASATALICLRALDDDEPLAGDVDLRPRAQRVDPDDLMIKAEIDALPANAQWMASAMDEFVDAAWGCQPAFELLMPNGQRLATPVTNREGVVPELARLITEVSGVRVLAEETGVVSIFDPAAGLGDLLVALLDAIDDHGDPIVQAITSDSFIRVLCRRLAVRGIPRSAWSVYTNTAHLTNGWDVLVTRMAYQPGQTRDHQRDLDQLRRTTKTLRLGQTAVIIGPASLISDNLSSDEVATRDVVLTSGAVEAIITLPGGVLPYRPGYQTAIWVLRRAENKQGEGRILLADVSHQKLTSDLVTDLGTDVITWRRPGYAPRQHRRAIATVVNIAEILGGGRVDRPRELDLVESLRIGPVRVAELLDLQTRLIEQTEKPRLRPALTTFAVRDATTRDMTTIGTLLANGHVERINGTRLGPGEVITEGNYPVIGIAELEAVAMFGSRMVDRLTFETLHPKARRTQPGDVVIALTDRARAYVDADGYSVVAFPAVALKINPNRTGLTPRVLSALINASSSAVRAAGAVHIRRLDQIHLPDLDQDEILELDVLLRDLDQRRQRARAELDTMDAIVTTAVSGLADGTLTISPTEPRR